MKQINDFLGKNYKGESVYVWNLLLFFLIVRIVYILVLGGFDKSEFMDANGYNEYALTILKNGSWLTKSNFLASWREPIYPFFVTLIYFIAGAENFFAVYIVQAILGTSTLYFIYKLSLLAFGNRRAAILSLLWSGFHIGYLRFTGELLREALIIFLVIYFFYQAFKLITPSKINIKKYILLALIYACLIHTDGRYLFYAPFLFFIFILKLKDFKISLIRYFLFGALTVLLTIPWSVRNYLTYGNIIVVSKYTLCLDCKELSERNELFNTKKIDKVYGTVHFNVYNKNYPSNAERELIKKGKNPNKRKEEEIKLIKKDAYPSKTIWGRKWYHIKSMWQPFDFAYTYSPFPQAYLDGPWSFKHNLTSILSYGILLPFFLFAVVILINEKCKNIYYLAFPIVIQFILHAGTFGIERYRYPIDAFIIIVACFGIIKMYSVVKEKIKKNRIRYSG